MSKNGYFTSFGGGTHHSALIGDPPEHRDWRPGDEMHAPVIAPSARIEAFVSVDAGMYAPTRVGERTWLQKHTHIGHDAVIGDDCELAPGTVICGHVTLGDKVRCGVNSCVRPFITVGAGARLGAGTVVIRDVPPGAVVVGNPGRVLERERNAEPASA